MVGRGEGAGGAAAIASAAATNAFLWWGALKGKCNGASGSLICQRAFWVLDLALVFRSRAGPVVEHPFKADRRRAVVGARDAHVSIYFAVHGGPGRVLVAVVAEDLARRPYGCVGLEFVHEVARAGALGRDDDEAGTVDGRSACRGDVVGW